MWRGGRGLTRNIETQAVPVLVDSYMNILVLNSGSSTLTVTSDEGGSMGSLSRHYQVDRIGRHSTSNSRSGRHFSLRQDMSRPVLQTFKQELSLSSRRGNTGRFFMLASGAKV
jgi:hypothetical protein